MVGFSIDVAPTALGHLTFRGGAKLRPRWRRDVSLSELHVALGPALQEEAGRDQFLIIQIATS
jgi:hypothetical protein